jgi:hypothetical protein
MALILKDRVLETTHTGGTGTVTLLGAQPNFLTFSSAIGNGNTTYYTIVDDGDNQWEVGIGTVGAGTLSRDTVLSSSNGGSKVNFGVADKQVFCDYPASKSVYQDSNGLVTVPNLATNSASSLTPVLTYNASNSAQTNGATVAGSYLQNVMQNKSGTAGASTNFAVSNDLGTDSTYYGEFGMNSSVFSSGAPADFFSLNNGVYYSGHDGDISYGSGNGYKTYLAWGTTGNKAHVINATGAIGLNTNITGTTNFGTSGQPLISGGSSATPTWGTLGIIGGGTNSTATPTAGAVPYGTGTAYAFTSAGTTGQVLVSNGASPPTWATNSPTGSLVQSDIGTAPNQIPLNQYLGNMAYQDKAGVNIIGGTATLSSVTDSGLTSGRVTYASTGGLLTDNANMVFDGTNFGVGGAPTSLIHGQQSTNGSASLRLDNVNAGTGAQSRLYVTNSASANYYLSAGLTGTGFTTSGLFIQNSALLLTGSQITGGMVLNVQANAPIYFATQGVERMRIDGSGNVGIGTTAPAVKLDVVDATNIYRTLWLNETKTVSTRNRTGIVSQSYTGITPAQILLIDSNTTINDVYLGGGYSGAYAATNLIFYTAANNTTVTGTERMRVHSSGGVSIGNTTDKGAASLNVSGLIYPQQATTAAAPAYVKGAIYFDTTLNKLRVGGATAWETITSV